MDPGEQLAAARTAYRQQEWEAAYDAFSALRASDLLTTDDLHALADAAWWQGRIREVLRLGEECFQRYVAEKHPERAAFVALENALNWYMCGHEEVGNGWLSRGRRQLADLPEGPTHGYLWWIEAHDLGTTTQEAQERAQRLRNAGVRTGDPTLTSLGLFLEGSLAVRGGDVARGFALVDEAMLPVLAGQLAPDIAGELYCRLIQLCNEVADFDRARRWTQVTEQWCDRFAAAALFAGTCRVHRAHLLRVGGELGAAEQAASLAARDLAEINLDAASAAHYEVAEARRLRGELAAARASYRQAVEFGHPGQPGLALLALAEGRPDEADRQVQRCLAETGGPTRRAPLLVAQVEVACRRRDRPAAERAVQELTEVAAAYPTDGFRLWAELAHGSMLVRCGKDDSAVEHLRRALALADRCGAAHHASIAHRLLEELARPRAPEAPGGLTARQVEILTAVADGLSNREVAARLVISEKTVARHLANIYLKLDVGSRTAAVMWAQRHGLLGTASVE